MYNVIVLEREIFAHENFRSTFARAHVLTCLLTCYFETACENHELCLKN